ncbi:MAG TPA: TolC family protein [Pirellulales bacterium]|nr:TolC family protein [Pirellulales bacterium]
MAQSVAWSQAPADGRTFDVKKLELNIPPRLPGSEAPRVELPRDRLSLEHEIEQIYPELPPIPVEPRPLPGPEGRPYTLTELQRIAAANSPALRQAIADVQSALGSLTQARTYQNPTATYFADPTNNNSTTGVQGIGIDQVITTGGKRKLNAAAAEKNYENSQLALRAARNNLATQVRQAYFALLVDKETLAVTRAVARFTDEIYRLQVRLVESSIAAGYEPASLRAQAFTTRLAYQQAIATYTYDWKSLVALLGLRQLPLTQVAGQIDRFIPYYDYDQVSAYVLNNHTDILTARNLVPQARYNLKLAQVTPIPDVDVSYKYARDWTVSPFGTYNQFQLSMPLAIWDKNKGNIIAAQGALIRATEQQHNAEVNLSNNLANAYTNYRNNLYSIDYYRRYILPDLVRFYRGVYERRNVDSEAVNVGDLAFAQQNLSQNVLGYLGALGSMWSSVVAMADFLQTDDLFQMATPQPLPELPNFDELSRWACGHAHVAASCGVDAAPVPARRDGGDWRSPSATGSPSRSAGATLGGESRSPNARATVAGGEPGQATVGSANRLHGQAMPRLEAPGHRLGSAPATAASSRRETATAAANHRRTEDH